MFEFSLPFFKLLKIIPERVDRGPGSAVRERDRVDHTHIKSDFDAACRVSGLVHFLLGQNRNRPAVGFATDSDALCRALKEATSLILHPASLGKRDLSITLIDPEALRGAKTVRRLERLVKLWKLWKLCSSLVRVGECPIQVFECLLQHLAVAFGKPRLILLPLPLRKQTRQGSVGKPKLWILLALFVVPLNSLVVDKTCTTARACKLPGLRTIWPELERYAL